MLRILMRREGGEVWSGGMERACGIRFSKKKTFCFEVNDLLLIYRK